MHVDLGFCGPEEIRTPDLTRARCAEVTYGYAHAFTFSAIYAGQRAFSDHSCFHLLTPISESDVRDLLGAEQQSGSGGPIVTRTRCEGSRQDRESQRPTELLRGRPRRQRVRKESRSRTLYPLASRTGLFSLRLAFRHRTTLGRIPRSEQRCDHFLSPPLASRHRRPR